MRSTTIRKKQFDRLQSTSNADRLSTGESAVATLPQTLMTKADAKRELIYHPNKKINSNIFE
jgi:hypothetical protein